MPEVKCIYFVETFQIRVRAYQKNTPSKYAETDVVVTMLRNSNPPTFTPDSFSISVNYDDPVGKRVLQVQATDVDLVSVLYSYMQLIIAFELYFEIFFLVMRMKRNLFARNWIDFMISKLAYSNENKSMSIVIKMLNLLKEREIELLNGDSLKK